MRTLRPLPQQPAPEDYERILRPVYGLAYGLAQGGVARQASRPSERAWRAIASSNRGSGRFRRAALRAAVPATIWGINRLLHADFDASLDAKSISQSGISAATELAGKLNLDAAHTITGHTHRGGPHDGESEWALPGGGRLHNTGSWVFASAFHHPGTPPGPYWPGMITWLEDSGPPRRQRVLLEHSREELGATVGRLAASISPS
jgi:hypothetical protein